jgi:hypothetical protein
VPIQKQRRLLLASAPLVLLVAGCRSADLFAGPDPLGGKPPLAHDTVVLQAVIAAELDLISRYKSAISASSNSLLPTLLAQHQQHLTQLNARLIMPPGASPSPSRSPVPAPTPSPEPISSLRSSLRDAERASAASLTGQLTSVGPALAQLFASIAASDATHADALGGS